MNKKKLLELLADGAVHSGEALGFQLGVSRAAISKQIRQLVQYGIHVESIKGQGYRLSQAIEWLSKRKIQQQVQPETDALIGDIVVLFESSSTNDYIMQQQTPGIICFAEYQHSGRGRRGRQWLSPCAQNLSFSIAWMFDGVANLGGLSLAVGVLIADALATLGLNGVVVKWPNDILVNGAKLGGILIEISGDPSGECYVVIGIGLNVQMREAPIDQLWVSLASLGRVISRNQLAAKLLDALLLGLNRYAKEGFHAYLPLWQQYDACYGRAVMIHSGQSKKLGIAQGVNVQGALLLDESLGDDSIPYSRLTPIFGGEVSLKVVHDS